MLLKLFRLEMRLPMNKERFSELIFRLKALFFDWLFICTYLIVLLIITLIFYYLGLGNIPKFSSTQVQIIATLTSIIPIIIIFSLMEGSQSFSSFGKRIIKLKVTYSKNPLIGSLIRNTLKFLPWQFGHI